jgi:hypothetical protein
MARAGNCNGGRKQRQLRRQTIINQKAAEKAAGMAIMATATLETAAAAPAATVTMAATATPKAAKSATDAAADAGAEAAECNINRRVCVFEEDFHLSRQPNIGFLQSLVAKTVMI